MVDGHDKFIFYSCTIYIEKARSVVVIVCASARVFVFKTTTAYFMRHAVSIFFCCYILLTLLPYILK